MKKKTNPLVLGIILCFALAAMLFAIQSCKRDRAGTDRSSTDTRSYQRISAPDFYPSWSPDGNYLTFVYGIVPGSAKAGRPAPGANICVCNLSTGKWTLVTTDGKHNKQPDWVPAKAQ